MLKVLRTLLRALLIFFIYIGIGLASEFYISSNSIVDYDSGQDNTTTSEDASNTTETIQLVHHNSIEPETNKQRVNSFWLGFRPPSKATFYFFGVMYIVEFIAGCGGNFFVMLMFYRCKDLLTPATFLVLNLAVSDFIMLAKCPMAIYNNFMQGPATGNFGCRIYGFLGGLSGTASILTLTAIAIERYYVVVYPMCLVSNRTRVRPWYVVIFIWAYSLAFSSVPALDIGFSVYVPEGFLTTCSFDYLDKSTKARIFMLSFFISAYVIPLCIIVYSYTSILRAVRKSNRIQMNQERDEVEKKLSCLVVVVILLWFVAWTPYSIIAMLGVLGFEKYLTPLRSMVPALFCKTAACINPYVYATSHPRFRMATKRLIRNSNAFRYLNAFGSSLRTRSSTIFRQRSANFLDIERNTFPMIEMQKNHLEAVIEEDIIQEDNIDKVMASAELHDDENTKY